MTELINIVFIIISLIWITSFPIVNNNITLNFLHTELSVTEKIVINLGIFSNILLILSFYNINQKIIFYALLVLPLFNFFYLNKKLNLKESSMGMSSDYLEAIQYNATYLRIGTSIFGERSI